MDAGHLAVTIVWVLVAHFVGDYLLQTHHMAVEKTKRWGPAFWHGMFYSIPFLLIPMSVLSFAVIAGTHMVIDRYRLAKHLIWAKNQFAPKEFRPPHTDTGYPEDTPAWLATWLLIITDNMIHIAIAIGAILYL